MSLADFWNTYYQNGIIPNIWKGITGQTSADYNTDKTNAANLQQTQMANAANERAVRLANQTNLDIARETNQMNWNVAQENLKYQNKLFEYNKALQQEQWNREDTSYQRTKADMLAAGLNPLSMQGTNGAGEVVSQTAPQNNFQAQQATPSQAAQHQAARFENYQNKLMSTNEVISGIGSVINSVNDILNGTHTRDSLALQNDKTFLENMINAKGYGINYLGPAQTHTGGNYLSKGKTFIADDGTRWFDQPATKKYEWSSMVSGANANREFKHKMSAGFYDSDLKEERLLTALDDWISNGRMKELFTSIKDDGFDLLKSLWK